MKKSTINRILIGIIVFLVVAICVLCVEIAKRPRYTSVSETESAVIEEAIIEETTLAAEESEEAVTTEETGETQLRGKASTKVNIRDAASTDAKVLATVEEGYEFNIIEIGEDGWTCIEYEDGQAYISSLYVILID